MLKKIYQELVAIRKTLQEVVIYFFKFSIV